MKQNICKIKSDNWGNGSGFLCKIHISENKSLKVLMTNAHILEKKDILPNKKIQFSLNNGNIKKEIIIDDYRVKYTDSGYDITIIEIKETDGLNEDLFLEIYDKLDQILYKKDLSIYLLYYPSQLFEARKGEGIIKKIDSKSSNIEHTCYCSPGAGGGPLIFVENNKVIGIHKGQVLDTNLNLGTLLDSPIKKFKEKYEIFLKKKNLKTQINTNQITKRKETNFNIKNRNTKYFISRKVLSNKYNNHNDNNNRIDSNAIFLIFFSIFLFIFILYFF